MSRDWRRVGTPSRTSLATFWSFAGDMALRLPAAGPVPHQRSSACAGPTHPVPLGVQCLSAVADGTNARRRDQASWRRRQSLLRRGFSRIHIWARG